MMTITTKEALDEVMAMFEVPLTTPRPRDSLLQETPYHSLLLLSSISPPTGKKKRPIEEVQTKKN